MAVEDKFINADVAAGKLGAASKVTGSEKYGISATFEVAAADDDLSVYRIARLPANAVVTSILVNSDVITAATDYDIGLYVGGVGGAAKDADVYADGLDISSGAALGSEVNGLAAPAIEDIVKPVYILAGDTISTKNETYDLAVTANTVGSLAGTVTLRVEWIQG